MSGGSRPALLRTTGHDDLPEIWCRCDGGTRGFLSTVADAWAAAFSVEVRYGGVEILSDPGMCCYHGDSPWRFRHAHGQGTQVIDYGDVVNWAAEHDGYLWLDSRVRHRRSVLLDRASRIVDIVDQIDGRSHGICPAFHFGPKIQVELGEFCAFLSWPGSGVPGAARLELPLGFTWSLDRTEGSANPGGYAMEECMPAFTLQGRGRSVAGVPLATRLEFSDTKSLPNAPFFQAVSWSASGARRGRERETQAEAK